MYKLVVTTHVYNHNSEYTFFFAVGSSRRRHPSLNQILSDNGRPSTNTNSDNRSCAAMPLNVHLGYDNNINDPPPSYDDTQITRTDVANLRCTTLQPPVQSSDLNCVELNTFNNSARLSQTPSLDEPPPSYDEFMAICRSKSPSINCLPPNYANDHILYMTIPVDAIETAYDFRTAFISETEILCTEV